MAHDTLLFRVLPLTKRCFLVIIIGILVGLQSVISEGGVGSRPLIGVDLFAGAGGFSEGFRQVGIAVKVAYEYYEPARLTHEKNQPDTKAILKDILHLTPEEVRADLAGEQLDILFGSPPCTEFSGSKNGGDGDVEKGFECVKAFLRLVHLLRPRYWVMENVPRLLVFLRGHLQGECKDRISLHDIGLPEEGGFLLIPTIVTLNSVEFGVPQARKRVFLGDFPIPEPTDQVALSLQAILDALPDAEGRADGRRRVSDPLYSEIKLTERQVTDHFDQQGVLYPEELYQLRRLKRDHSWYGRMDIPDRLAEPARTVLARQNRVSREGIYVPTRNGDGIRRLTPREIACLMGFPLTYQFYGRSDRIRMEQIGNAVCPPVAAAIGRKILLDAGLTGQPPVPLFILREVAPPAQIFLKHTPEAELAVKDNRSFRQHPPGLNMGNRRVDVENSFTRRKARPGQPSPLATAPRPTHPLVPSLQHISGWQSVLHVGIGKFECDVIDWRSAVRDVILITYLLPDIHPQVMGFLEEIAATVPRITPDATTLQGRYSRRILTEDTHPDTLLERLSETVIRWFPLDGIGRRRLATHTIGVGGRRTRLRLAVAASLVATTFACYCAETGTEWMAVHPAEFYWPAEFGEGTRPGPHSFTEFGTCHQQEFLQEVEETLRRIHDGELHPVRDEQAVLDL